MASASATPWRIDVEREAVVDANDEVVATLDPDTVDAATIAAAPEMLKMLRITRANVASLGPAGGLADLPVYACYRVWLEHLDAVIAKAEGGAA